MCERMGSHMKKAVFDEQMEAAFKKRHKDIKIEKGSSRAWHLVQGVSASPPLTPFQNHWSIF